MIHGDQVEPKCLKLPILLSAGMKLAALTPSHEFNDIMEMVDKRLNDSGKNWRHVFKVQRISISVDILILKVWTSRNP